VLVMERLPGRSYSTVEVEREVGERLFRFAVQSALELALMFGVFHGDLHAGNILLDEETATLSLVDFGILGRLSAPQRMALGQLMVAFAHGDVRRELEAMVEFGAIPRDYDLTELEEEIRRDANPHDLDSSADRNELAEALTQLLQVVSRHGIRLPRELVLFCKNLLYINGFAASVAPDVRLMDEVAPVFAYFQQKYGEAFDLTAFLQN
jgi:ubiquinone biosynthesis protein